jgi:hypothetical protein
MFEEAKLLRPSLREYTRGNQPVRVWIAKRSPRASDLLWAGYFGEAIRVLHDTEEVGKKAIKTIVKEEIKKENRSIRGLLPIKFRERDDRTDWRKVK